MFRHNKDRERLGAIYNEGNPLHIRIIILSDRASAGIYKDQSGPTIHARLAAHFGALPHAVAISVIPDHAEQLRMALNHAIEEGTPLIITSGGTGVGPRDITPDVVIELADKIIPGIMEFIRIKHGAEFPPALLSRSVAAVARSTLIYALPGNPKAMDEYLDEILKTIDHLLCVIQGEDTH
ncbi:MAG: MogA/MoaB family molybdenum cofactor biosynthesis protein [Candidatus Hydrogenedentales bacterium]